MLIVRRIELCKCVSQEHYIIIIIIIINLIRISISRFFRAAQIITIQFSRRFVKSRFAAEKVKRS